MEGKLSEKPVMNPLLYIFSYIYYIEMVQSEIWIFEWARVSKGKRENKETLQLLYCDVIETEGKR